MEDTRFGRVSKRVIDEVIDRYDVALTWVLDRQAATLVVAAATLAITVVLYIVIPKGLFPTQDTGVVQGVVEAAQSVSYGGMAKIQQDLAMQILKDPDVASLTGFIGVDGTNTTLNNGRLLINLQPFGHRTTPLPKILDRLRASARSIAGVTLYVQPVQDLTIDSSSGKTQ